MIKKCMLLFCGAAAVLISYACSMPLPQVELTADNISMSVPLNDGSFNLINVFSDSLADSFPDGVEIYDMVDYEGAQAFLIGYKMALMESFNPGEYLDSIKDQMNQMDDITPGIDPIEVSGISIPKLAPETINQIEYIEFGDTIANVENQINNKPSNKAAEVHFNVPIGLTAVPLPVDELQNIPLALSGDAAFNTVKLASGKITLQFALENYSKSYIDISLNGIRLKTEKGDDFGTTDSSPITLNSANGFSAVKVFDLANEVINMVDNKPQFTLESITDNYKGAWERVTFDIIVMSTMEDFKIRGATGLEISDIEKDLPSNIANAVKINNLPDGLLNADIGDGSLEMIAALPVRDTSRPEQTYFEGMDINYKLVMTQAPVNYDGKNFPGLGGLVIDSTDTANVQNGITSFTGKTISGSELSIDTTNSKVFVKQKTGGVNFELWGQDFDDKRIPINFKVEMKINRLETVRWKLEDKDGNQFIPKPDIPEIDFGNIDGEDISKFVKSISFDEMRLGLNVTKMNPALENRLALRINCADFGFNNKTNTLILGENNFSSNDITLPLTENNAPKKITVNADVFPVLNNQPSETAKYMELGPLSLSSDSATSLDLAAEVDFDFNWTKAEIDLNAALENADVDTSVLKGAYPEKQDEWIDLYGELGKNMSGFTFSDNVKMKMFLSGPNGLIEKINPQLTFTAKYKERINREESANDDDPANWKDGEQPLFTGDIIVDTASPSLPGKNDNGDYIYEGMELPSGGMEISGEVTSVLAASPKDLRFDYEMLLPKTFEVTPTMFDDVEDSDSGISALIIILMPLELQASKGAFFIMPADALDNSKDLFGRKNSDDTLFGGLDINIKSAAIKLDFDSAFFKGARLYIDKDKNLFPDGIMINDGNNDSMQINITGDDWNIVKENIIYPEIKFVFPEEAALSIPRRLLPNRITVAAGGSFILDLKDM